MTSGILAFPLPYSVKCSFGLGTLYILLSVSRTIFLNSPCGHTFFHASQLKAFCPASKLGQSNIFTSILLLKTLYFILFYFTC